MKDLIKTKCICCSGKGFVFRKKRGSVTENQKKEIIKLYKKGLGIREIQRQLKIQNPYSVTYALKTANDNKIYITSKKI